MKAHEFITRLDEARYGRRVSEDTKPVAEKPSHAPTSTAQWKTKSGMGKSEDEGEKMGGEKDAIKQSKHEIPAPVAPPPSHAPTSGKDYTTTGKGSSEDEGEKVSKEAIKETVAALINGDEDIDVEALLGEGGHKDGCQCGFCMNLPKNKGKKKEDGGEEKESDGGMNEDGYASGTTRTAPPPAKHRLGFRSPLLAKPRPKAAINPYQPAMEHKTGFSEAIRKQADKLLDMPGEE